MSNRLSLALSLAVLTSAFAGLAAADRAYAPRAQPAPPPTTGSPRFAQPPPGSDEPSPDPDAVPDRVLDRVTVRAALARQRTQNLIAFRAYRARGVFPSNVYKPGALNVWRDPDGHFCAAATIIRQSGQVALTDRVAEQNNFLRLAEVQAGPVMDWMLMSGLTQEEIAMIQAPFMPVVKAPRPVPDRHLAIDARLRAEENARLQKVYANTARVLAAQTNKSLDLATLRLMKHQLLAWQLIESNPG
jgi:hypothetical protein